MRVQNPRISVVTPVYNRIVLTREFLGAFSAVTYPNYEIIIVDDGSTDGSAEVIEREFPSVRLIRTEGDLWWSKATNVGVLDALNRGADFILTINDDVSFEPDFLTRLVDYAADHPRTLVGSAIFSFEERDKLWYGGGKISYLLGELFHRTSPHDGELRWLTGLGALIPSEVFRTVGLYDDIRFPQYFGDADFSMRAREAGFELGVEPLSIIFNRIRESTEDKLRRNVTVRNFLTPLFTLRSSAHWRTRRNLYRRHWPLLLRTSAIAVYYFRYFAKSTLRLLKIR
jgi:GT2 family glycosyltransferase